MQLNLLPTVIGHLLDSYFPNLLILLQRKHVTSLDFIIVDCSNWFLNCFEYKDLCKLWISAVSFTSVYQFLQVFITGMLLYLAPFIDSISFVNTKADESPLSFHLESLQGKLDISTILSNAKSVLEKLKPSLSF